jgi:transposase-like protein
LCCPRAIITALTYYTDDIFGAKRNIEDIRKVRKVQTELAEELRKRLGDYNEEGFTLEDIKNVEELLNIQVKVVCAERFNSMIYSGEEKETKIYLYKNSNHFDVINRMKSFLGSIYYCCKCDKPYNNKNKHRCSTRSDGCKLCTKPMLSEEIKIKYFAKTVTDTVLTKTVLITTMMFARMFINAKLVIRLR